MIFEAADNDSWNPVSLNRRYEHISHLIFADDLLLFSRATSNSCATVHQVMSRFATLSSLKTSLAKSSWVSSKSVSDEDKVLIQSWLGFPPIDIQIQQ